MIKMPQNTDKYQTFCSIKLFEDVIQIRIVEFIGDSKLLSLQQFDFSAEFTTAGAFLYATEKIWSYIDNKSCSNLLKPLKSF